MTVDEHRLCDRRLSAMDLSRLGVDILRKGVFHAASRAYLTPTPRWRPTAWYADALKTFLADEGLNGAQADRRRRWQLSRTRGSHRQYKHPTKPGLVTVSGKPSDELHPKTSSSILKQAGLGNDTGRTGEASERGKT